MGAWAYEIEPGNWRGQARIGKRGPSRSQQGHPSEGAAQRWAEQAERELLDGPVVKPTVATTVAQYGPAWLARKTGLEASSRRKYDRDVRVLAADPYLGPLSVAAMDEDAVVGWVHAMEGRDYSANMIHDLMGALARLLNDARRRGLREDNPTVDVRLPKRAKRRAYVATEAQRTKLLDAGVARGYGHLIVLGLMAGLRRGEALGVRASDLRGDVLHVQGQVTEQGTWKPYTKGEDADDDARPREVPLGPVALAILQPVVDVARATYGRDAYLTPRLDKAGRVIVTRDGQPRPYRPDEWKVPWAEIRAEAGCDDGMRFHDLRHTFATLAADAGMPSHELQALLGHADERMTRRYVHAGTTQVRRDVLRKVFG